MHFVNIHFLELDDTDLESGTSASIIRNYEVVNVPRRPTTVNSISNWFALEMKDRTAKFHASPMRLVDSVELHWKQSRIAWQVSAPMKKWNLKQCHPLTIFSLVRIHLIRAHFLCQSHTRHPRNSALNKSWTHDVLSCMQAFLSLSLSIVLRTLWWMLRLNGLQ